MAIGSIVVLTTSTLNRILVVELALPAMLSGALVGLYYAIQLTRPTWGYRSDAGGARSPWILGGIAVLAAGGLVATFGTVAMEESAPLGIALATLGFVLIGGGVGASGTSLLALLATATSPERRAAAATITWLMMIAGIALTAAGVGAVLDPYSHARLVSIVAAVCTGAVALSGLAMWGVERRLRGLPEPQPERVPFRTALAEIWGETRARHFAIFVFLSMTAYFMQELIIEPFAGHVFHFTPGQSTSMAGLQSGGVFLGMLTVGVAASLLRIGSLKVWTVAGCLGSAVALAGIATRGSRGPGRRSCRSSSRSASPTASSRSRRSAR
jgi:MFS transporter, BCD family, chlorophyll transporter